jgi:putative transposase
VAQLRQLVSELKNDYRVSEGKACGVVMVARSTIHYEVKKREDRAVRKRIREIAETRVRYGFWRIHVLLRREGWQDNHKRTYRIYREEGLNLREQKTQAQ